MNTLILLTALTQLPVELHVNQTVESRLLLRAIHTDIPCLNEDLRAIRYYQDELRRVACVKQSLDTFIRIGQHKTRFPLTAYDSPAYTVLAIKREVDRFNRPRRIYARELADADFVRFAGMVDLGDDGQELAELAQPWEDGFVLSAWKPPEIEK